MAAEVAKSPNLRVDKPLPRRRSFGAMTEDFGLVQAQSTGGPEEQQQQQSHFQQHNRQPQHQSSTYRYKDTLFAEPQELRADLYEWNNTMLGLGVYPLLDKEKLMSLAREPGENPEYFGSQADFFEGIESLIDDVNSLQGKLSPYGFRKLGSEIESALLARKAVIGYVQAHPEVTKEEIKRPLILVGSPRTGTTLLFSMLAADPGARAPLYSEVLAHPKIVPPFETYSGASDGVYDSLIEAEEAADDECPGMWEEIRASHPSYLDRPDEDWYLLEAAGLFVSGYNLVGLMGEVPEQSDKDTESDLTDPLIPILSRHGKWWFRRDNKSFAYTFHKRYFQILQHQRAPGSHWVLKAPIHSLFMEALAEAYPDANVVFTHRAPLSVIPSYCRCTVAYARAYFAEHGLDLRALGRIVERIYRYRSMMQVAWAERQMEEEGDQAQEWRAQGRPRPQNSPQASQASKDVTPLPFPAKQTLHLPYTLTTASPLESVQLIYQRFGYNLTDDFLEAVEAWTQENKQGKHGRARYTLEEYGVSRLNTEKKYRSYVGRFLA